MPNPMIRIHNATTDEVIDREMTDAEHEAYLADLAAEAAIEAAKAQAAADKLALLDRLGITEDEAKLLLS
jgi:hypothetical protein